MLTCRELRAEGAQLGLRARLQAVPAAGGARQLPAWQGPGQAVCSRASCRASCRSPACVPTTAAPAQVVNKYLSHLVNRDFELASSADTQQCWQGSIMPRRNKERNECGPVSLLSASVSSACRLTWWTACTGPLSQRSMFCGLVWQPVGPWGSDTPPAEARVPGRRYTLKGWKLFAEAHGVNSGDHLSFELLESNRLVIQVIQRSSVALQNISPHSSMLRCPALPRRPAPFAQRCSLPVGIGLLLCRAAL